MFKKFDKIETVLIQEAMKIAYKAHHGQLDRASAPYIFHPITVATIALRDSRLYLNQTMCCIVYCTSILHDVPEDTTYTIENIRNALYKAICETDYEDKYISRICDALECLTRSKTEKYSEYIQRVESNYIARIVKLADLTHNMDTNRLDGLTSKDVERMNKYNIAKEYLELYNLMVIKEDEKHLSKLIDELKKYD